MPTYTVIALTGNDSDAFLVAGVIEGEHNAVDSQCTVGSYGQYSPYATFVEADDPDEAMAAAEDEFRATTGEDHDDDEDEDV